MRKNWFALNLHLNSVWKCNLSEVYTLWQPIYQYKTSIMESIKILGLRTTIYKVGDIQKAKEWYAKAFATEPYFDEPFYVGFSIGGYELGLQPEDEPTTDKVETVVSYWGVDNINDTYSHFLSLGATESEAPYSVGGDLMTATVRDPFGNVIGLIYNPYFKLSN